MKALIDRFLTLCNITSDNSWDIGFCQETRRQTEKNKTQPVVSAETGLLDLNNYQPVIV
jgi:hypothetical protein